MSGKEGGSDEEGVSNEEGVSDEQGMSIEGRRYVVRGGIEGGRRGEGGKEGEFGEEGKLAYTQAPPYDEESLKPSVKRPEHKQQHMHPMSACSCSENSISENSTSRHP